MNDQMEAGREGRTWRRSCRRVVQGRFSLRLWCLSDLIVEGEGSYPGDRVGVDGADDYKRKAISFGNSCCLDGNIPGVADVMGEYRCVVVLDVERILVVVQLDVRIAGWYRIVL